MIQPTINTEVLEITSRKANYIVKYTHCEQLINITSNSHIYSYLLMLAKGQMAQWQ